MAIYRYPHESLIDSLQISMNEKGGLRAYLYADDGKDTERLRMLKQGLRAEGYKCVPTLNDGKPVLEVRGFKKPGELLGYLHQMRAFTGKPEIIAEENDKRTRKEKFENSTLKMAGLSYNVGDAAYMYYAAGPVIAEWNKKLLGDTKGRFFGILGIVAGIGYTMGSFCLTFFGSKDQSINTIHAATSKVERFARTQGYKIAPESSIAFSNQDKKRDTWGNIKQIIGRYPSESLNSIYVGVGLCMSAASFYHATRPIQQVLHEGEKIALEGNKVISEGKKIALEVESLVGKTLSPPADAAKVYKQALKDQKWDKIDVGLGVVTATSAIIGLAVKEQKRLEGDPKRHGIAGAVDWVKEKPLRATGIGYGIATAFHTVATYGKWADKTEKPKYLAGRAIFILANVFSEGMLFMSSKGHGIGVKPDSSINDSVISAAAELALRQPIGQREAVISQLSGYIASPDVLAIKAEDVEKSIRNHIAELDKNPWTKHYVPTASGEMVEAAPVAQPAPATLNLTYEKPSSTVSNAEYVAKQHATEHALA